MLLLPPASIVLVVAAAAMVAMAVGGGRAVELKDEGLKRGAVVVAGRGCPCGAHGRHHQHHRVGAGFVGGAARSQGCDGRVHLHLGAAMLVESVCAAEVGVPELALPESRRCGSDVADTVTKARRFCAPKIGPTLSGK